VLAGQNIYVSNYIREADTANASQTLADAIRDYLISAERADTAAFFDTLLIGFAVQAK
jgi:hypothetical protein